MIGMKRREGDGPERRRNSAKIAQEIRKYRQKTAEDR